ncbi:hypothetical protein [Rhizobium lentis]|uniref:Uncharacterized protein n=1 Tax=Rhizobium lentis TaxID=1138194 RepID=A0A7W9CYD1_9HYPH|nr:hypothetical protein [Rhizobium lentis]MBB4576924.1 hypothetical protein [Rhizobium lentis]MBB5553485.1 hypothetical protein [Rhizobium lentis]MBB5564121.1 hypothetical protein [Rhizobium lentis]MBB5570533.1 hypothetical protein [Rhizobium lentis]
MVAGLESDCFARIVAEFLASWQGAQGLVGEASVLVDGGVDLQLRVAWLEQHVRLQN